MCLVFRRHGLDCTALSGIKAKARNVIQMVEEALCLVAARAVNRTRLRSSLAQVAFGYVCSAIARVRTPIRRT